MHVEDWPLDRIKPYPQNPRKRSKKAVEKVAASIREFGWRQPIVVDEDGVILAGHGRYYAALHLECATVPVHQARGLSEAQKRAHRIADNRTNEESEWDADLLKFELQGLEGFDLSITGLTEMQITSMIQGLPKDIERMWQGMPDYECNPLSSYDYAKVFFSGPEDRAAFYSLLKQDDEGHRPIWFPYAPRSNFSRGSILGRVQIWQSPASCGLLALQE